MDWGKYQIMLQTSFKNHQAMMYCSPNYDTCVDITHNVILQRHYSASDSENFEPTPVGSTVGNKWDGEDEDDNIKVSSQTLLCSFEILHVDRIAR